MTNGFELFVDTNPELVLHPDGLYLSKEFREKNVGSREYALVYIDKQKHELGLVFTKDYIRAARKIGKSKKVFLAKNFFFEIGLKKPQTSMAVEYMVGEINGDSGIIVGLGKYLEVKL